MSPSIARSRQAVSRVKRGVAVPGTAAPEAAAGRWERGWGRVGSVMASLSRARSTEAERAPPRWLTRAAGLALSAGAVTARRASTRIIDIITTTPRRGVLHLAVVHNVSRR